MPPTSLLQLIGNTPLVELSHLSPKSGVRLFAKLEGQNPSGSIKDRIVLALVESAEQKGKLKAGDTIIEASSGNTAIALALVGKHKGYAVEVVLMKGVAPSIPDILRLLGARVTWCEPRAGMKGAIDMATRLAQEQGHLLLGQFTEAENPEAHYRTTGQEIVSVLPEVDAFVAGIGTGGTIMGVGKRLREDNSKTLLFGVEPKMGERLQGLRSLAEGFLPPLLDLSQLDGRFLVDSASAFEAARMVAQAEGILVGASSGAVLHAALRVAQRMDKGTIVVMFSDGGWKYLPARPWDAAHQGEAALDETTWW
jgi:cysteine synthase B